MTGHVEEADIPGGGFDLRRHGASPIGFGRGQVVDVDHGNGAEVAVQDGPPFQDAEYYAGSGS